jgi:hypothetical protein
MIAASVWGWDAWAWLVIPLAIYCLTSLTLFAFGHTKDLRNPLTFFFSQIGDSSASPVTPAGQWRARSAA